jgi:hypothetical protein
MAWGSAGLGQCSCSTADDGHWSFQSLFSRRYGIAGGTDEVQKNIIGERQLGLPK